MIRHSSRRDFLKGTLAGSAAGVLGMLEIGSFAQDGTDRLRILRPAAGAVLCHKDGKEDAESLTIRVEGTAPEGEEVFVDGARATRSGTDFTVEIAIRERTHEISAACRSTSGRELCDAVRVVWDKGSKPRYRMAIDDNGFFLRDIVEKNYNSLFDCPYLKMLRDLNRKYHSTFVLNCFYALEDGFAITEFPEKYRGEWKDNGQWLKLAFHSYSEFPMRPYQDAPPEKLMADWDLLTEQLIRIAGEEAYSPTTVLHWGMAPVASFKPLAAKGVRTLSGYFRPDATGKYDVNYCMDDATSKYIYENDRWRDFGSGITFSKIDLIVNCTPIQDIVPTLESVDANPRQNEVIDLLTHEQYFWPFYKNYLPDHPERMDTTLRWVTEKGYEPVWFHEGLLGNRT